MNIEWQRYLWSVRHLRPVQIWHQCRRRVVRHRPVHLPQRQSVRWIRLGLQHGIAKNNAWLREGRFRFLNREADLNQPVDWSAERLPLLWRYNLHYFDYLLQPGLTREQGFRLMVDWLRTHGAPSNAVGWQPYPLSLRIVNWLKFLDRENIEDVSLVRSVWQQAFALKKRLEYHLLGNHLFANAKALWFAGAFLGCSDLRQVGRKIVLAQLCKQFLPDGGHFELSPMYHAAAVEDLLDLINLCHATNDAEAAAQLQTTAANALTWLDEITRPRGVIPLLNDSAHGIAATPAQLANYGRRLRVPAAPRPTAMRFQNHWTGRNLSGYWLLQQRDIRLIFDTAKLGPSFLPGHAHCDMLSVLFDFRNMPIFTDTGVFEYAETARRTYCRSTAAHNTVVIDDFEQADIWKSFRMGKRGHPIDLRVSPTGLSCAHTGFAKWRPGLEHRRELLLHESGFEIADALRGPAHHRFKAMFHFAPNTEVSEIGGGSFAVASRLVLEAHGAKARVVMSDYYPEFGIAQERACLILSGSFSGAHRFSLRCTSFS